MGNKLEKGKNKSTKLAHDVTALKKKVKFALSEANHTNHSKYLESKSNWEICIKIEKEHVLALQILQDRHLSQLQEAYDIAYQDIANMLCLLKKQKSLPNQVTKKSYEKNEKSIQLV